MEKIEGGAHQEAHDHSDKPANPTTEDGSENRADKVVAWLGRERIIVGYKHFVPLGILQGETFSRYN